MIPASFLPPASPRSTHPSPAIRLLLYHFQSDSRLPPFCFFTLGRVTRRRFSVLIPLLIEPHYPRPKLLISYVFEWTLLAPRNFETLIFNNSASAHGILIFRSFNGKRPRPFVHWRSHLTPSLYVRSDSHGFYVAASPPFLTLRLDIQSLRDVLSRFLGHELAKKLNFVRVKFHPVERPLPGIVTCSRPSSTWRYVHNSSSAFAGAGRPRQKTFSFSFRERSKESYNRAILAM